MRKDLVLIEIPLPQVTEHDDQSLHSEASHPGVTLLSSNMARKEIKKEILKGRFNLDMQAKHANKVYKPGM